MKESLSDLFLLASRRPLLAMGMVFTTHCYFISPWLW